MNNESHDMHANSHPENSPESPHQYGRPNIDPLKEAYRETIANVPERIAAIRRHHAALLCIDMQYLDAARGYGVFADAQQSGVPLEA